MDLLIYCLALIILGVTRTKEPATTDTNSGVYASTSVQLASIPTGQNLQLARITGAYTYILKELRLK